MNKGFKYLTSGSYFKTILLGLTILLSSFGFSQTNSETIKQLDGMVYKMFEGINNKDFDVILEMTHPKVYDIVPKDQMKSLIKSMFEGNGEFSIEVPKEIPEYKISEVFKEEDKNLEYAFVSYDMKMNMTFHNQEFDDAAKESMVSMMKAQNMDVEFVSNNSIKVLMKDRLNIFLKDEDTENKWVMVNYDADSPLFYQILSTDLIEATKAYNQELLLASKKETEN